MTKPLHWLAPAAALLCAVGWLWSQHREIATLTAANAGLRTAIAAARAAEASAAPHTLLAPLPEKRPDPRKSVRDYVNMFAKLSAGESDYRLDNDCFLAITRFTREDCADALDELRHMELSDRLFQLATVMMSGTMVETAPDIFFEHVIKSSGRNRSPRLPSRYIFKKWTDRDPQAAANWMDRAIQDSMFACKRLDGKYDRRIEYEECLVLSLAAEHPGEAQTRLARTSAEQREIILKNTLKRCTPSQRDSVLAIIDHQISDPDARERIINPSERAP